MLEPELLPFVHSNVGRPLCSREKLPGSHGAMLWLLKATATIEFAPAEERAWLVCWLKMKQSRSKAARAGGTQLSRNVGSDVRSATGWRNSRRSSFAEGRRGTQERNRSSSS